MGGKGDFKVLGKLMGAFSFMDYEFAFVAWLWFVCREHGLAPAGFSRSRAGPKWPSVQDGLSIQLYLLMALFCCLVVGQILELRLSLNFQWLLHLEI